MEVHQLVLQRLANVLGDEFRQCEIINLSLANDVVLVSNGSVLEHEEDSAGNVARVDVEAAPWLRARLVGMDRYLLAVTDRGDELGDVLLRVLPLSEHVHAVSDEDWNSVRVRIG